MVRNLRNHVANSGFTRVDLLVAISMLGVLAMLTMPLLGSNQTETSSTICLANKRQLMRAFAAYTTDNEERMPGAYHGGDTNPNSAERWVEGWLDWNTGSANTNTLYLTSARYAQLAPYVKSNRFIFKCPSDIYLSAQQKRIGWRERVRSYSGNLAVGEGNAESGPWNAQYAHVKKTTDFNIPAPSEVYVFLDEHPDSLNDPGFFSPVGGPGAFSMVDVPASFHDGGNVLSFADGSVALHRWKSALRTTKVTTTSLALPPSSSMQTDLLYLYQHTPRLH